MKRNLLALFAIVLAVAFSAFSVKPLQTVYFVYDGVGQENDLSSYQVPAPTAAPATDLGGSALNWFRGQADDPEAILDEEFESSFNAIDNQMGGTTSGILSDETEDGIVLEKK